LDAGTSSFLGRRKLIISKYIQNAISLAVKNHPYLGRRAFFLTSEKIWSIHPNISNEFYSTSEAIITGLLLELYHGYYGLPDIDFDYSTDQHPSESVWAGAKQAALLSDRLDAAQQKILQTLMIKG